MGKHKGGRIADIYVTSKGNMTIKEMVACHPFGLSADAIRSRGILWGYGHKCIWWSKAISTKNFGKLAYRLGGDRQETVRFKAGHDDEHVELDRGKCCFRNKFQERCVHYMESLNTRVYYHEPLDCCSSVIGGTACPNYRGEALQPATISLTGEINDAVQHTVNRY